MLLINNGVCPVGEEMHASSFEFYFPKNISEIDINDRVVILDKVYEYGFVRKITDNGVYIESDENKEIFISLLDIGYHENDEFDCILPKERKKNE